MTDKSPEELLAENVMSCNECDSGYNTVDGYDSSKWIIKDKWGISDEFVDDRKINPSFWDHIRKIKQLARECEKHNIDIDVYVDSIEFDGIIGILDCCLKNKDNRNIARRNK